MSAVGVKILLPADDCVCCHDKYIKFLTNK